MSEASIVTLLVAILASPVLIAILGRRVSTRIGQPNGGGSVVGEIAVVRDAVAELRGEVRADRRTADARFDRGEQRFDRLERGHESMREGLDNVTNVLAQQTAAIERLNDLHDKEQ